MYVPAVPQVLKLCIDKAVTSVVTMFMHVETRFSG